MCACGACFVLGSSPECGDLLGESVNEAGSSNDIHVSLPLVLLVSSLDVVSLRVVSLSRPVRFCATASYALLAFTQTVLPRTATSARFPLPCRLEASGRTSRLFVQALVPHSLLAIFVSCPLHLSSRLSLCWTFVQAVLAVVSGFSFVPRGNGQCSTRERAVVNKCR